MSKRNTKRAATAKPRKSPPEKQGANSGAGYRKPPVEHQFKPGQSGNPAGRKPLGITLAQHVRDIGSEVIDVQTGWTRLDAMIRRMFADAMTGKAQAAEILLERGWGKVMQPVEVDWRVEARQVGVSEEQANAVYAAMVEAARAQLDAEGASGSGSGSTAHSGES